VGLAFYLQRKGARRYWPAGSMSLAWALPLVEPWYNLVHYAVEIGVLLTAWFRAKTAPKVNYISCRIGFSAPRTSSMELGMNSIISGNRLIRKCWTADHVYRLSIWLSQILTGVAASTSKNPQGLLSDYGFYINFKDLKTPRIRRDVVLLDCAWIFY